MMARLPIAWFFAASRSKNWSRLALSNVWPRAALDHRIVRIADKIIVLIPLFLVLDDVPRLAIQGLADGFQGREPDSLCRAAAVQRWPQQRHTFRPIMLRRLGG
jgi:hypothetical protein